MRRIGTAMTSADAYVSVTCRVSEEEADPVEALPIKDLRRDVDSSTLGR